MPFKDVDIDKLIASNNIKLKLAQTNAVINKTYGKSIEDPEDRLNTVNFLNKLHNNKNEAPPALRRKVDTIKSPLYQLIDSRMSALINVLGYTLPSINNNVKNNAQLFHEYTQRTNTKSTENKETMTNTKSTGNKETMTNTKSTGNKETMTNTKSTENKETMTDKYIQEAHETVEEIFPNQQMQSLEEQNRINEAKIFYHDVLNDIHKAKSTEELYEKILTRFEDFQHLTGHAPKTAKDVRRALKAMITSETDPIHAELLQEVSSLLARKTYSLTQKEKKGKQLSGRDLQALEELEQEMNLSKGNGIKGSGIITSINELQKEFKLLLGHFRAGNKNMKVINRIAEIATYFHKQKMITKADLNKLIKGLMKSK